LASGRWIFFFFVFFIHGGTRACWGGRAQTRKRKKPSPTNPPTPRGAGRFGTNHPGPHGYFRVLWGSVHWGRGGAPQPAPAALGACGELCGGSNTRRDGPSSQPAWLGFSSGGAGGGAAFVRGAGERARRGGHDRADANRGEFRFFFEGFFFCFPPNPKSDRRLGGGGTRMGRGAGTPGGEAGPSFHRPEKKKKHSSRLGLAATGGKGPLFDGFGFCFKWGRPVVFGFPRGDRVKNWGGRGELGVFTGKGRSGDPPGGPDLWARGKAAGGGQKGGGRGLGLAREPRPAAEAGERGQPARGKKHAGIGGPGQGPGPFFCRWFVFCFVHLGRSMGAAAPPRFRKGRPSGTS